MKDDDMNIYVCETSYVEENGKLIFTDVSSIPFLNSVNPLFIGARTGQVNRMKNLIALEKLGGLSIGWWELAGQNPLVFRSGKINWDKLKEYDVIFFADPSRVHEKIRPSFTAFIEEIKAGKKTGKL